MPVAMPCGWSFAQLLLGTRATLGPSVKELEKEKNSKPRFSGCQEFGCKNVLKREQDKILYSCKLTFKKIFVYIFVCFHETVEALHLGTLMAAHGYFFPISDHVLTLKDDGTFYRFQVSLMKTFLNGKIEVCILFVDCFYKNFENITYFI